MKEIKDLYENPMPKRSELERVKKQIKYWIQQLNLLRQQRGKRSVKLEMMESRLYQRVLTIQEREERRLLFAIRRKIGPGFHVNGLDDPPEATEK